MQNSDFDVHNQTLSTESKIVASLERISQAFRVLLWQESKDFSLSPLQVQVLIFLLHHDMDKRKVSYLADEFNMTKATISDTIKSLEQKGLILKVADPLDIRSYSINLTIKGKEIAEKTSFFTKEIHTPIDKLHQEDKENMLLGLFDIIRHLNKSGVITIQRMCLTCSHYKKAEDGQNHFCTLLNQDLHTSDLRIDCPEHQVQT